MIRKIVLAFDTFKDSATSLELAQAAQIALLKELPDCQVLSIPIADGGEGTTQALCSTLRTNTVHCNVHNPLMQPIEASYAITTDKKTAIIEMAASSGLPLVPPEKQNPLYTTTYGTGELIADALDRGCRRFIIGLGGSATNDAGIGALTALGIRFLDHQGKELSPIGKNLKAIESIDDSWRHKGLTESEFTLACDVDNPFSGPQGAAHIFAPQKGALPDDVLTLDEGLKQYASILKRDKQIDITSIPGAGAAGGMSGGLLPFLPATIKPGIETLLEALNFKEAIKDADLIITGEGKLDAQTSMGKALSGLLVAARDKQIPVVALAGQVEESVSLHQAGFTAFFSIQPGVISLEKALLKENTLKNLQQTVVQVVRLINRFKP